MWKKWAFSLSFSRISHGSWFFMSLDMRERRENIILLLFSSVEFVLTRDENAATKYKYEKVQGYAVWKRTNNKIGHSWSTRQDWFMSPLFYLITSLLLSLSRVWRKKYPVVESSTFLFRLNRDRNTAFRLPNALVSHAKWPRLLKKKGEIRSREHRETEQFIGRKKKKIAKKGGKRKIYIRISQDSFLFFFCYIFGSENRWALNGRFEAPFRRL